MRRPTLRRRSGTQGICEVAATWTPDQQRTTPRFATRCAASGERGDRGYTCQTARRSSFTPRYPSPHERQRVVGREDANEMSVRVGGIKTRPPPDRRSATATLPTASRGEG